MFSASLSCISTRAWITPRVEVQVRSQPKPSTRIVGSKSKLVPVESILESKTLEDLRLDTQLDELAALPDGWLDGDGAALDRVGLEWFGAKFADLYPADLPPAYLYPTPEGGLQVEWSVNSCELALEVDLKSRIGEWYETGPGDHSDAFELDLDKCSDWARFENRVRTMMGSDH